MSWTEEYRRKLITSEAAAALVRPGDRVYIHPGCCTPEALVGSLLARRDLHDVEIVHLLTLGNADYANPQYEGRFRANALFIGGNVRPAIWEGRADYTPVFLHEIEPLFSSGAMPLDVVFVHTTPPDEHGFVSLGAGVDCSLTAAQCARHVVAQVNPRMPRTLGNSFLHISQLHAVVEAEQELPELHAEAYTDVHRRIADHVAPLVPNGATLQMGIGAIPDAVLMALGDHCDLGIHTEMFSDGVIPLIEKGVLNGKRKSLHPGKLVAGFTLGTRKLFNFIDNNPLFEFHPIVYVNDPFVIAQNDRMVAINSAIEVDITGQVCSDSIGTKPYSGFGGQVDFIRGAAHSKGGKPIIALPATAKDGQLNKIVPTLKPGAGVVTSRADVHYVATEFGVAYLHGKTIAQRVEAMIQIADPKFRESLYEFAYREHYLRPKLVPALAEIGS
jgi:acyl-CoA hydrolase